MVPYGDLTLGSPGRPDTPFSDPNTGITDQALGRLAAEQWLHGTIPWWNPFSGIGLPLAGEMQPAALFLPFVLLLHFESGILWLIGVLQALSGVACLLLFRQLGFRRSIALTGALLFEFNGTFAMVPGEATLNVVPFLPILLLGIEYARDARGLGRSVLLVGIGIGWSLLGGFPETAFMDGIFALFWAASRLGGAADKRLYVARIVLGGCIGLLIAAPAIVSFLDFTATGDIFGRHKVGFERLDPRGFGSIVLPFIFGRIGDVMGSGMLLSFSAAAAGYVMLLLLPFCFAGLISRRLPALRIALAAWIVIAMGKTFGIPPVMQMMNLLPFMKEIGFIRFSSPTWELAAITLTLFGLEALVAGRKLRWPMIVTVIVFGVAAFLARPWADAYHWQQLNLGIMAQRFYATVVFTAVGLILVSLAQRFLPAAARRLAFGAVLVANALIIFSVPQLSGQRGWQIDWPAIRYLQDHLGLGRFYTVGPIAPNYSAYFGVASINHNYLPIAANWARHVATELLPATTASNGAIFWPPFPPMSADDAIRQVATRTAAYRAVGVRYVVTGSGANFRANLTHPEGVTPAEVLSLAPGGKISMTAKAPAGIGPFSPVTTVAVYNATYSGTSDGALALTLCAGGICGTGAGDLALTSDNQPFWVTLDHPVALRAGETYTLDVVHRGGQRPDAIGFSPRAGEDVTLVASGPQSVAGKMLQVRFATGPSPAGLQPVYSDRLMEIWHLEGATPYFRTAGAACALSAVERDRVTADCKGPATLLRQELFMPGWRASVNGRQAAVTPAGDIMQALPLSTGLNLVRFHFAPPYILFGWIAFWAGMAALLAAAWISWRDGARRISTRERAVPNMP